MRKDSNHTLELEVEGVVLSENGGFPNACSKQDRSRRGRTKLGRHVLPEEVGGVEDFSRAVAGWLAGRDTIPPGSKKQRKGKERSNRILPCDWLKWWCDSLSKVGLMPVLGAGRYCIDETKSSDQ